MIERLHETIAAVCPIDGVSLKNGVVRINYLPVATAAEMAAAEAALASFDWSQAAEDAWEEDQQPERKAIRQAAAQAIADNSAFLALASPTNAQVFAQTKRLTQECTAIIKRVIQIA